MTLDEAIYILRNTAWLGSNDERDETEQAVETVVNELERRSWIPCSERLPDKPGSYICTCSDGTPYQNVTVIKFHPRTKAWVLNSTRAY